MPSSSFTNAPKSATFVIGPVTSLPTGYLPSSSRQGFAWSCLMPSENFSFSLSIFSTTASTTSPLLNFSDGCLICSVHEMSETCTSPSIPSSRPTNTPKLVTLRTAPETRVPTGYFCSITLHGFGSICFMPSEILRSRSSTSSTTASTVSHTLTTLDGCLMRLVHDISDTCTRPSIPGSSSRNAPYSASDTTRPEIRLPIG